MKISVFTPSHDLKHINRPLESLKKQTFKDFEWIILLNGKAINEKDNLESKLNKANLNYKIIIHSLQDLLASKSLSGEKVILYKTETCPWCAEVKALLQKHKIDFEEKNVGEEKHSQELQSKLQSTGKNAKGVPVTDFDGVLFSGFKELSDIFENNIGALKKKCCEQSSGEILVELDHDDELTNDCLEKVAKTFEEHNCDFCFSDDYMIKNGEYIAPFSNDFGWTKKYDSQNNVYHPAHEPDALSFSYIWYAPDHVRAWRKSFYQIIGGHDPLLDVCDDYDLVCKSYIHGNVKRIPEPLYRYHIHEENTSSNEKNEKIQKLTHDLHDKYILELAAKWCDLNQLKKVDLCSCNNKPAGFIGVDKRKLNNEDIEFDLDQPNWPFDNGSVGVFRLQDALEHMKDPINTMKEMYRCLADFGWVIIDVPSTDGRGAFQDPTHVSYWNSNSFWYYTKSNSAHFIGTPVKFQLNRIDNYFPSEWHEFHNILYTKAHLVKLPDNNFVPVHGREI